MSSEPLTNGEAIAVVLIFLLVVAAAFKLQFWLYKQGGHGPDDIPWDF